jgi:site-specific DNA recombinase
LQTTSYPKDKLKQRLRDITHERGRINQALTDTSQELGLGAAILRDSIELVRDPHQLYSNASGNIRGQLNQTF